jgi:hypothetical protein
MRNLPFFIALSLCSGLVYADFPKPTWCDKAKTYPEKTVCDDDGLSASAIALENRWKAYRETHTESEIALAKTGLNDWNKDPFQKCENKDCIRAAYTRVQSESWYQGVVEPSSSDDSAKTAIPGKKVDPITINDVKTLLAKSVKPFDMDAETFAKRFGEVNKFLQDKAGMSVDLSLKDKTYNTDYSGDSYVYRTGNPHVYVMANTNADKKIVNVYVIAERPETLPSDLYKYIMLCSFSMAKALDRNLSDDEGAAIFNKLLDVSDGEFDDSVEKNNIKYKSLGASEGFLVYAFQK